ncbi:homocysteine S-methyltransferase family protein [Streptomyces sp. NPDC058195]|uniref:homocysteine S-methyltransferase family protein n=1 Tax=Streptomyces sp. NPDC058195 TaxID=3346375 RepID=UPI0036F121E4
MSARPRILDGGTATGLQAAGFPMVEPWLTSAALRDAAGLDALVRIHASFLESGSSVVTANTFRANTRALERMGVPQEQRAAYVRRAVACTLRARDEAGRPDVLVAASVAPVEDCYTPALTPDSGALLAEHRWMAAALADSGADLVLVETQCTRREAVIAVEAAVARGLVPWVSFVVAEDGALPDGVPLRAAARACVEAGARAVSANCLPLAAVAPALERLCGLGVPVGVYPNLEDREALDEWEHSTHTLPPALSPPAFADLADAWARTYDLDFIGGCCGTAPEHIRALAATWQEEDAA